jgi:hypothetical protein
MTGRFGFHVVGTSWSGVARVASSLDKHSRLFLHQTDARAAYLSGKDGADKTSDLEERTKQRVDRFQASCLSEAHRYANLKWGCLTHSEQIGRLLDPANAYSWAVDDGRWVEDQQFNAVDYFACRCIDVPTIFVLRDGRACIPAKVTADKTPLPVAINRWRFSIYVLTRFAQFSKKLWVVRIEDLMNNPQDEMRTICEFLGIELEDTMVNSIWSAEVKRVFAPLSRAAIEKVSKEPWVTEISDDLAVGGYLDP